MIPITLMPMPNITAFSSVNAMNVQLQSYFDSNINEDSYTCTAVSAVLGLFFVPFLTDVFGVTLI